MSSRVAPVPAHSPKPLNPERPSAIATALVHGLVPDGASRPLVTPLVHSTTFVNDRDGGTPHHAYSRVSNPTVSALESRLGALERAEAVAFASGLAAETALLLALARTGSHVVCGRPVYGGTYRLLAETLAAFGVDATFVDATDPSAVVRALRPSTVLVVIETPANPTLALTDIRAVVDAVAGRAPVAVDNTFLTPVGQQPLDHGAAVSVYSTTKLIEGHSAAVGGAIVTRDAALADRLRHVRKCTGSIAAPTSAWTTLQGLKTLDVRLRRQSETAERIARWLAADPRVIRVNYPTLSPVEERAIADRQHRVGHGNVVSFVVDQDPRRASAVALSSRLCAFVEHVGSVESLLTHPATMTHADVPAAARREAGIPDGLLRLSVGLEDGADLIDDLDRALAGAERRQ